MCVRVNMQEDVRVIFLSFTEEKDASQLFL